MRTTHYIQIIFSLLLLLTSCGDHPLNEQTLYVADEAKQWLTDASVGDGFLMVDSYGITDGFNKKSSNSGFLEGSSYFAGIHTNRTFREYYDEEYSSTYGKNLRIGLEANYTPFGDEISVDLGGTHFLYSFKFGFLVRVSIDNHMNYIWLTMGENEYYDTHLISSTATFIDSIIVNGNTYKDVMHYRLADFLPQQKPFTVTEIFIAKHYGLLKYVLNNGIVFQRITN
jgi:hypothetical protein